VVLALSGLVRLFEFLEESSLEFTLLSTVGTAVVGLAIGLRLVRRVLSGGRILGIPRTMSINAPINKNNNKNKTRRLTI
jgi:hypothetical protein